MLRRTATSGPSLGVEDPVRREGPLGELVAAVLTGNTHRGDLGVLAEGVVELAVALEDLALDVRELDGGGGGQRVHLGDELAQGVGLDEVDAVVEEGLDRRRHCGDGPLRDVAIAAVGEVEVLLAARQGELLADQGAVGDEPGVVVPGVRRCDDVPRVS